MNQQSQRLIEGRALDLTGAQGFVCGKMMANYGVDVIKIEPPGGDPSRKKAPYIGGVADPDKSIYWQAFNTDKRGITLDLESETGQKIFLSLVETADFVIESFEPGYLDRLGIGYQDMKKVNPAIVVTSITPFGQKTSRSHYRGGELICSALGATMDNIGDPDRAPLLEPADTNTFYANACALAGTMFANYSRNITGIGEHVDISIEECAANRNPQGQLSWSFNQKLIKRMGPFSKYGAAKVRTIWACKDGFVNWTMFAGPMGAKANEALSKWMTEDGLDNPLSEITDWPTFDLSAVGEEKLARWEAAMAEFFKGHTKEEFRIEGTKRRLAATVLDMPDDLYRNEQLNARGFWKNLEYPEWDNTVVPVANFFMRSSIVNTDTNHRAPHVGEHNEEILHKELGLDLDPLQACGVI